MENTNYTLQENIRALVNGELDETTRYALLKQAKVEPEIADELGFSQSLARALRHRDLVAASVALSAVIAEEGFPPHTRPIATNGRKWWVWTSVGVIVLLSLTGGYFWAESAGLFASRTQKISRSALQPLENVLFISNNGQALADLQTGMAAYEAARYDEAASLLKGYVSRNPDNTARVYLGVAQLMAGQSKEAIPPLADAAQSPEPPIQEAALYYLALAYLENNNARAAIQALESIPPDSFFSHSAQDLLKKLK